MNKADLIDALAPRLGSRAAAGAAVEAMVDVVLREVAAGGSVGITGFGTFERVQRAPRTGRNPRTGETVPIPGTATPRFRPATYFKDVVADPTAIPQDGPAGVRVGTDRPAVRTSPPSLGAPASVRRSGPESPGPSSARTAPATAEPEGTGSRPATSGTPATVRKDRSERTENRAGALSAPDTAIPQQAGTSSTSGGDGITAVMISAKKAQLAQVKVDESAARKKARKKDAKKAKKKRKKKN